MALVAPSMRTAHSDGHTEVCYDATGSQLLTCGGGDGDIKTWKDLDDDELQLLDICDSISSFCVLGSKIYAATDSNSVQTYLLPDGAPDGILCRFTAAVTHIALSEDGTKLVAGGGDFSIKLVDLQDSSNQKVFDGHSAPILSVALDPKLEYLASSSCDGCLKIWTISDQNCEKSVVLFPKCSDTSLSKTLARIAWKPKTGELLAIPLEKEILLYARDSWEELFRLKIEDDTPGFTSVLSWSPSGLHLASASSGGLLNIWDMKSKKCISSTKEKKGLAICSVAWKPRSGDDVAITNTMGQVGIVENVLQGDKGQVETEGEKKEDFADLFDDMADEDLLDAVTQAEEDNEDDFKKESTTDMPDTLTDNMDALSGDGVSAQKEVPGDGVLPTDDMSQDGSNILGDDDTTSVTTETKILPPPIVTAKPTPLQKPFIPSSTPAHLSSRFMKWNMVGIIRCYDTDEESTIDVEFHDASVHHALHFDNQLNHTMADLNKQAVLLGTEGDDEETPSQIVCHYFASWDSQKEWSVSMPKDEIIKALALGGDFLAVATNKRHVRVFSLSGIQKNLFCIPGPVVTMAAEGQKLIIVYHQGIGVPGDQCLGVQFLQLSKRTKAILNDCRLPLSAKSTLTWLGFTVEGSAAMADSNGIIRLFNESESSWIPTLNTKSHAKGKSDHHWIIGMEESPAQVRCISCKGSTFPPTLPRPTPILLPFQLPFCDLGTDKGQMEESYWRGRMMNGVSGASSQGQDTLMKMFALSCRADREVRAADVCKMMTTEHAWTLAIKYASRSRKIHLAEKLSEMAAQLLKADEEDEEEEEAEETWGRTDSRSSRIDERQPPQEEEDEEEEAESDNDIDMETDDLPDMKPTLPKQRPVTMKPKQKTSLLPLTPVSSEKRNPFRKPAMASEEPKDDLESSPTVRGTNVFDNMKRRQNTSEQKKKKNSKQESSPPSTKDTRKNKKSQMTLMSSMGNKKQEKAAEETEEKKDTPTKRPASAFHLWLAENRETIANENREVTAEPEILKLAIQKWREVDPDTKKEWNDKAKLDSRTVEKPEEGTKVEGTKVEGSLDKKRKREEDDKENNADKKLKAKNIFAKSGSLNKTTIKKLANFARD